MTSRTWLTVVAQQVQADGDRDARQAVTAFLLNIFLTFKKMFIYLFCERDGEGQRERESERENPKQPLCRQHRAQCGA